MSDYIKREDAIKALEGWKISGEMILGIVPSADVVEVVRCKDCKWYHGIGCAIKIVDESDEPKDNDYCSFGEREE